VVRRPSSEAGAERLADEDLSVDFTDADAPADRVAVIVTEPLTTDETWQAFAPGELKVFVGGEPVTPCCDARAGLPSGAS